MPSFVNREHLFRETPYPERYRPAHLKKTAATLFVVLFSFLILYRPFGVYEPELKFNYYLICAMHAFFPALILYSYFSLLNYFRKRTPSSEPWSLFRECMHITVVFFLIGIVSFLVRGLIYDNPHNWSFRYLWEEIRNCYLAGSLFYFLFLLGNHYFQSKKQPAAQTDEPVPGSAEVFIGTQVKQDNFVLDTRQLLFAKADGNYVELTFFRDKHIVTELKRISLRQLEAKLSAYPFLFRAHRAYLLNIRHIEKVSGNSQGYWVSFRGIQDKLPVSRAQLLRFNSLFARFGKAPAS